MSTQNKPWKVSEETRRAILKEYRNNPSYSYQELAAKFGIAESTAWKIVNAGRQTCTEALESAHQNINDLTSYVAALKVKIKLLKEAGDEMKRTCENPVATARWIKVRDAKP